MKTTSSAGRSSAATGGPLAATTVSCILPVKDMARARRLFEQSLGLEHARLVPQAIEALPAGGAGGPGQMLAPLPRPQARLRHARPRSHVPSAPSPSDAARPI